MEDCTWQRHLARAHCTLQTLGVFKTRVTQSGRCFKKMSLAEVLPWKWRFRDREFPETRLLIRKIQTRSYVDANCAWREVDRPLIEAVEAPE